MSALGVKRVALITDPYLLEGPLVAIVKASLASAGIEFNVIHAVGTDGEMQIKLDVVDHRRTFHDHPSNVPLLYISVQDNGCGMDAKTLSRLSLILSSL